MAAERDEADPGLVVTDVHLIDDRQDELLNFIEVDSPDAA